VLTAVESERPVEAFEAELLDHDSMVQALDPDLSPERRRVVVDDVVDRLRRLGDGVAPVVERPEDEFWPAVRGAFDEKHARSLVETVVPFTGPLRRHRDAFAFEVRIDPADVLSSPLAGRLPTVSLEYTDEAIRAMRRAERRVVHEATSDVADRFD